MIVRSSVHAIQSLMNMLKETYDCQISLLYILSGKNPCSSILHVLLSPSHTDSDQFWFFSHDDAGARIAPTAPSTTPQSAAHRSTTKCDRLREDDQFPASGRTAPEYKNSQGRIHLGPDESETTEDTVPSTASKQSLSTGGPYDEDPPPPSNQSLGSGGGPSASSHTALLFHSSVTFFHSSHDPTRHSRPASPPSPPVRPPRRCDPRPC